MNKIFVTTFPHKNGKIHGLAIAETGQILIEVLSESIQWAHFDLGIDSGKHHDVYSRFYPEGFQFEIVDSMDNHEEIRSAFQNVMALFHQCQKPLISQVPPGY